MTDVCQCVCLCARVGTPTHRYCGCCTLDCTNCRDCTGRNRNH